MKRIGNNKLLSIGISVIGIALLLKYITQVPDSIYGFLTGLGIGIELLGIYSLNHDISKLKNFKKKLLKKLAP